MEEKWKVQVYESPGGDRPVEEFLNSLDEKARLKVSRTFELFGAIWIGGCLSTR